MPRQRSIKKLPRHIGFYMDQHSPLYSWVEQVLLSINSNSVVVTTEMPKADEWIRRTVVMRRDLYYKVFECDQWEKERAGRQRAEQIRDYMFLSYLKFYKGFLFICPKQYVSGGYGTYYSKRTEALILMAHELKLNYTIIDIEGASERDQYTKHTSLDASFPRPTFADPNYKRNRKILSESRKPIQHESREDSQDGLSRSSTSGSEHVVDSIDDNRISK